MTVQNRHIRGLPDDLLLPRDTSRSVPIMLVRARDEVISRFRPLLARFELSEQQWRVLRVLGEVDCLEAREVAERACVLAPSLTRILKSLEERGFVTRRGDPDDRRRILLSITPRGMELLATMTRDASASYAEFVEKFGADRVDTLLDMLADLVELRK